MSKCASVFAAFAAFFSLFLALLYSTAEAASPSTISITQGNSQHTVIATSFSASLQVQVKDSDNKPVSGQSVIFSAPAFTGTPTVASGIFPSNSNSTSATATTDSNGNASINIVANTKAGGFVVSATVGALSPVGFSLTNDVGAPRGVSAVGQLSQSAQVNKAFAPLQVLVTDLGSNPVPNVNVTFTAPSTGASGTFPSGNTATTDASGIATMPFTANGTTGQYTVNASASGTNSVGFVLFNTSGSANNLTIVTGDGQSATVSTAFSQKLKVRVVDSNGSPVADTAVLFSPPSQGAGASFAGTGGAGTANTDASGIAESPIFTANGQAGSYTISATVQGSSASAVNFTETNLNSAGTAAAVVTSVAGTPQSAALNHSFSSSLQVMVKDANGNSVANVPVTFTAPSSGASGTFSNSLTTITQKSDAQGQVAVGFSANGTAGTYTVSASASGVASPATFQLTNVGAAASIVVKSGTPQSTSIGTNFANPLSVVVTDSVGNPVPGASVIFAAPTSTGATATFAGNSSITETTGPDGIATATAPTANNTVGSYAISASVSGATASFSLTNTQGGPSTIAVSSETPQTAAVSSVFASPLQAIVKDSGGNPVSGVQVSFITSAAAGGATGSFAGHSPSVTVTTGANGIATATTFTANALAGTYTVTAAITGNANIAPATFTLTNGGGVIASLSVLQGSPQSTAISTAFATTLKLIARDGSGNPLAGLSVVFAAPTSGAGGTFGTAGQASGTTGNDGTVEVAFTANAMVGSYIVTATSGSASARFSLSNINGSPASIVARAGTPQTAPISTVFSAPLQAYVTDPGGNPISGAVVTFNAPSSGASGAFLSGGSTATATTNTSGVATAPTFRANAIAGANYIVTASVTGASTPASFALTNAAGPPDDPTPVAGTTPQSTVIFTQFANNLRLTVTDAGGNPVPGITATFTAPTSGASGTFAGSGTKITAVTDGTGVASAPAFTANGIAGTYHVIGSVVGSAPPADFVLTNIANAALNIVVNSSGRDGSFNFSSSPDLGGVTSFTITTSGGSANRAFTNVSGQHTVTLLQLPFGYKLTSAGCTSGSAGGNSVIVAPQPGATITCTFAVDFDADGIRNRTMAAIRTFMQNRADAITSSQPTQTRGEGRFTGSLFGGPLEPDDETSTAGFSGSHVSGTASAETRAPTYMGLGLGVPSMHQEPAQTAPTNNVDNPLAFSGNSDSAGGGSVSGSISLASLRSAEAQRDANKAQSAGLTAPSVNGTPSKFNIWAEAYLNYYQSQYGEKHTGKSYIGYVGADYLIAPAVLFGILGQYDYTDESVSGGVGAHGGGWMVGPYTAIKLTPQITFDARGAWGQSTNDVNPFGLYEDSFNTDRTLGSARLTGSWKHGAWRFNPEASFVYFSETQASFTDKVGVYIPNQTVSLERFEAGPEVGYRFVRASGTAIEPFVGLKAVYDLSRQDAVTLDGTAVAPDTLRGRVESGVTIKAASGFSLQGSASYDGIGTQSFHDVQGQLSLRLPLN